MDKSSSIWLPRSRYCRTIYTNVTKKEYLCSYCRTARSLDRHGSVASVSSRLGRFGPPIEVICQLCIAQLCLWNTNVDKSSSIWLPRSISMEAKTTMYSAGVPVPQGYHITVANSFSPVKWYPGGTISPGFDR